ncbi:MAG: amidohydrolase, partial [Proteobacteria bacterium]|nr:amidohydrolase [Pseudomonadota bacterium]
HTGIAETGLVGVLRRGSSNRAVALRADMDALNLTERNDFEHRSSIDGKMHGCGHDGHTTMLLGAAEHLAANPTFNGTVYFIFQPAEEAIGGARVMIEEGLFERFPVEGVYGMHNMPGLAMGRIAASPGPVLAAADIFTITITGVGGHAAFPHRTIDPVFAAGEIIVALQSIVARITDPLDSAVISVTMMKAGEASNIIPETATLTGSARTFTDAVRDLVETTMKRIVEGIAAAHGATATLDYVRGYPATVNHPAESKIAARAAAAAIGAQNVVHDFAPMMGAEDFSYMLRERPGCHVFIGNGEGDAHPMCHSPDYDFNDDILPIGVSYWARLVEEALGPA